MKEFFNVKRIEEVLQLSAEFQQVGTQAVSIDQAHGRVLASNIVAGENLPEFSRSTMDGYAVRASSTFGASEGTPAYLVVTGSVAMGEVPQLSIGPGEAARISTGGMLPGGADAVVMVEHAAHLDDTTIEVYRSVAPGQHVIEAGEDMTREAVMIPKGRQIRPQEIGLLAALGIETVPVFKLPDIGIISTGDEIVPIHEKPAPGKIRDINSYTLAGLVEHAGGIPHTYGIVGDSFDDLLAVCSRALSETDMVLVSGGSSVGMRDFTIEAISALPDAGILVHGISISPGKPTILARAGGKPFWGLPGHVVSAMVVFQTVVRPFIDRIRGVGEDARPPIQLTARLSRNIPSAQGRVDFVRVRLSERDGELLAEPILGKSGLISTMVRADGLIKIGLNTEGLEKNTSVSVIPV